MNSGTPHKYQFKAYMLLFLVCNVQIGVGIFGFQRYIYKEAGHDAWMSVLLVGIATHLIVWIMVKTLDMHQTLDLYGIQQMLFGKWIGGVLGICMMLYFLTNMITIVRTYIEAIQSWIFPDFPTWLLSLILLVLMVYGSLGGIRIILQMSFISFFLIIATSLLFNYPIRYVEWSRILPIYDTTVQHIAVGAIKMGFSITGFEVIYMLYRHVKDKDNVMRYAQASVLFTNILYLFIMVVSIIYFSENQMLRTIWGSINLLKIIKYPFLERIEFIAIPFWMLVVLPGIMQLAWNILRGTVQLFGWNEKLTLYATAAIVIAVSNLLHNRGEVNQLNDYIGLYSVLVSYCYPLLLYVMTYVVQWRKRGKGSDAQ
ncbi:GerAB/ArcD/ProY family transporter [Paenibacillus sp. chi10]|uniref:GerAB/ArcD/ProY family transporter n=1 Tax=Paenibacillus suaedae TaxID=3077233 RepID=A0AAJ2JRY6_9BACL|nr:MULTISPECIES: GerAB/ArcD/ProY family transporter [unclassified Paenibacillus]MDT8974706.1 GerAB/ArcD/ProY family transporter [Paenibacillus sp. chi10]GAV10646.1 spore germination protein [Paenibacillus sp. NAIST15-1]